VTAVLVIGAAAVLAAGIGVLYLLARAGVFEGDGPGRGRPDDDEPADQLHTAVTDLAGEHGTQWLDDGPGGTR
jgi:hypothetical protein